MSSIRPQIATHLAVGDEDSQRVQDILALRHEFRTLASGIFGVGDVVIHVVPQSSEYGYARHPEMIGDHLVVGAIVLAPVDTDDFVAVGLLDGSHFGVIVNRREAQARANIRRFCDR